MHFKNRINFILKNITTLIQPLIFLLSTVHTLLNPWEFTHKYAENLSKRLKLVIKDRNYVSMFIIQIMPKQFPRVYFLGPAIPEKLTS